MPSDGAARPATTPLDALEVLATQDVMITANLRHLELYTPRGLLSVLWHEPAAPGRAAVVMVGGAMGGLLGPANGFYQRFGDELAALGVPAVRVSYRRPNDLEACTLDVAVGVQLAIGAGADQVVVMGHSFGGAPAIRAAVALPAMVAGVATFATQSAGCEVAGGLAGRPLLLFHGDRDEILPVDASRIVAAMAGAGDVVVLPGDGHLLAKSEAIIRERLLEWLPATFGDAWPS